MNRTLTALATAIALLFLSVAAAFAWPSQIEGRPASFEAGGTTGIYFWHEPDDGLHLRATDQDNTDHHYTGRITTDGAFHDLDLIKLEQDDEAAVDPSGHVLTFNFHTYNGIDGIDYYISGGTQQTLDLRLDGRQLSTDRIFLGEDSVHPNGNPMAFHR